MILLKLSIYAVSLLSPVIASARDDRITQGDVDLERLRPRKLAFRGHESGSGGGENVDFLKDERIWMNDRGDREDVLEGIPLTFGSAAKLTEDSGAARPSTAEEPSSSSSIVPPVPLDHSIKGFNSLDPSETLGVEPVTDVLVELDNRPRSRSLSDIQERDISRSELFEKYKTWTDQFVKCMVCVFICRVSQEQAEWPNHLLYPRSATQAAWEMYWPYGWH
ncbi:hypothetical protein CTA1_8414 [Colletotrichum tanaceti]|uniref:Uncharacterized protein n=1 Tax=Colletotrichum tanaceti TaxID=1306861 RepID=A0A4U6X3E9_9PEZI|nr:hypothetical protein CTA1_8414 [Colletotrichum tanaceti]